VLCSKYK